MQSLEYLLAHAKEHEPQLVLALEDALKKTVKEEGGQVRWPVRGGGDDDRGAGAFMDRGGPTAVACACPRVCMCEHACQSWSCWSDLYAGRSVCVCVCVLCSWQAVGLGFKVFAFACTLEVRNTCESGAWGLGALFMWFRVMVTGWYNP